MKNILLYLGLFFLVVLLLLPPGLRIFGKNLYKKDNKVKDIVELLKCNKENETISSTFLNKIPQNFQYKLKGNYLTDNINEYEQINPDENNNLEALEMADNIEDDTIDNRLVYNIKKYASIVYDDSMDISTFTIELNNLDPLPNEIIQLKSLDSQKSYLEGFGFSCSSSTL